ncbi:MAG: heparinase II/III family protein [Microbacterium sp.]|uniref:heparinase II/III domain-containing protein n=1 Tax=Microbacterium sp. TaxID=51671 RepID=UPI0039E559B3
MTARAFDDGSSGAVFAEGRDPHRWREPIRNRRIAASARRTVERALTEAGTPIVSSTFAEYRRFDDDGDRTAFQRGYFRRRRRLFAAVIGALLSDEVPISAAEDVLWAVCDEYAWALPAHIPALTASAPAIPHDEIIDLFAAETAFALAEIVVLLGDRLHPLVAARVRHEVERRVLTPFRERTWFWEGIETNWAAVCAAGVGLAAMHLQTEGLAAILDRCTAAMDVFLAGYGDDGICVEGLVYWNYGFGHFAIYAEALRQRTGEDLWSGSHHDKLAAALRFAANVSLGGRAVAAFSDAEPYGVVAPGLAALVESRDADAAVPRDFWWGAVWPYNWGPVVRQFAWARDAEDEIPAPGMLRRWFPDAGWLVVREDAGGSVFGFAAKAGHNQEPHNHNDLGSFVLVVDGEPLLSELGMGFYDRDYFRLETRYASVSAGSQGHSVPIVAGVCQRSGTDAAAVVQQVSADEGRLVVDITSGYDVPGLREVRRSLGFADGTLTISDRFVADEAIEIIDRLVSFFRITLVGDGAEIHGSKARLRLRWNGGWRVRVGERDFLTHDGDAATAHMLDLVRTAASAECVVTVEIAR